MAKKSRREHMCVIHANCKAFDLQIDTTKTKERKTDTHKPVFYNGRTRVFFFIVILICLKHLLLSIVLLNWHAFDVFVSQKVW